MRLLSNQRIIPLLLRLFLGVIFFISAVSKLFDTEAFVNTIYNYGFLSLSQSEITAVVIIIAELVLSILLLLKLWIKPVSLIVSFFVLVFITATIPQILVGNVIDCNCFGFLLPGKTDASLIIKDMVLLFIALMIYAFENNYIVLNQKIIQ